VARIDAEGVTVRQYRGVFRYLAGVTGSRDLAEDLTQEVFLRVARAAHSGDTIEHERGWVFSIARSVVAAERRQRRQEVVLSDTGEPAAAATAELAAHLSHAMQTLEAADRDVLLLREIGGLTYQEIAAACGCTVESVRSRLHRTRSALRRLLSL